MKPCEDYEPTDDERMTWLRNGSASRETMRWAFEEITELRAKVWQFADEIEEMVHLDERWD